ncbi:glucosaminidase domain-containing protein [Pseudocolwellia sp. HL-MZ7]|uniref:glucosaminidase domain-containing protein n=1 Tax=Pseudocolwellia sp. HL-MZ7 TaxID=3400627 RepID=UPI003CEFF283
MNILKNKIMLVISLLVIGALIFLATSEEGDIHLISVAEAQTQNKLDKLPDFSQINDVKEKKEQFFNTLYPIIKEENKHVLKLRQIIVLLQSVPEEELTSKQKIWLNKVATHYKVSSEYGGDSFFANLLERVDVIPPSLALTQAAIESGWGTSRFSKKGNNLFGQWCFSKGCGIVPSSRDSEKFHEVAKFASVNLAVRAYIKNLNTNAAYIELRKMRSKLRKNEEDITGLVLAKTLDKYSEEGQHYVTKVSKFIDQNKLQRFTNEFNESIEL